MGQEGLEAAFQGLVHRVLLCLDEAPNLRGAGQYRNVILCYVIVLRTLKTVNPDYTEKESMVLFQSFQSQGMLHDFTQCGVVQAQYQIKEL